MHFQIVKRKVRPVCVDLNSQWVASSRIKTQMISLPKHADSLHICCAQTGLSTFLSHVQASEMTSHWMRTLPLRVLIWWWADTNSSKARQCSAELGFDSRLGLPSLDGCKALTCTSRYKNKNSCDSCWVSMKMSYCWEQKEQHEAGRVGRGRWRALIQHCLSFIQQDNYRELVMVCEQSEMLWIFLAEAILK